ncbi:hypothetical protein EIP86_008741 [Pleurotus ostreatoroseus]|nr:hypothetical protein EIP86_008741 [Pleurotus ostreatoroseus]
MSKPDIIPKTTLSGISVDPRTLERVIPQSKRPDGSVRKEIKIRPGFTPQEDVQRFRGSKQVQMDANTLPKGHIVGWTPPSSSTAAKSAGSTAGLSKSAKKNAKRKEKRKEKAEEKVKDSWEDDDDDEAPSVGTKETDKDKGTKTPPTAAEATKEGSKAGEAGSGADGLADEMKKLDVR